MIFRSLLVHLSAWVLASSAIASAAAAPVERWHVLSIDGADVGSIHEIFEQQEQHSVSTESTVMVLKRLGSRIETGLTVRSVEDTGGDLMGVELSFRSSEQAMELTAFRESDEWVTRSAAPGVPDRRLTLSEPLIGPKAVAHLLAGLDTIGDSVTYTAFVSTTMQPGKIRAELTGHELVDGQNLRVIDEHLPGVPAPITRVIDEHGLNVITRMPGPFGLAQSVLADELSASWAREGVELPEEIFEKTILKTGVRLPEPRRLEYVELELRHRNPELGWPEFDSSRQRVLSRDDDRLVLAIERLDPSESVAMGADVPVELASYLSANSVLQVTQPELVRLAASLTAGEVDRWQAALSLRRWVSENLAFDSGVVFAPSSEILQNRRGTCTEFAVLLTALARAAGIPARYVQGYVYAHGMFAGHAWSEVRIGDDWVALDAALPSEGAADAARFAFVWSGFDSGPGELNAGASMQMFGQIDARVIAWRGSDGAEQRFPDDLPVPQVVDGRFVDRIQNIEWTLPGDWVVVDYEETWPSNLVAAAEHPDGDRIELRWVSQHPWERAGIDWIEPRVAATHQIERQPLGRSESWLVEHDGRFRLIQAGKQGHWQLSGTDSEQLREVASGLRLPPSSLIGSAASGID